MFDASDFDSSAIPLRDFVYAELLLGGYVTVCAGPGGTGKSVLSIVMAVSVALGRELIPGYKMKRARNVLMLNNEDDKYELQRRITAVCACYDIDLRELENRLWVRSGYSYPAMVASIGPDKRVKATPEVELIIDFCKANHVDLIICDPFISTHNVNENDNVEMNMVVQIFKHICAQTNAAVLLIAHTKKLGRDTEAGAGDPESGRGASSVKDAGRITFTLARMSREHAKVRGITWQIANNLVRMDDGKKNLTPMDPDTKWFRLTEAIIPNGERSAFLCCSMSRLSARLKTSQKV
jgi:RecA-family ATPase